MHRDEMAYLYATLTVLLWSTVASAFKLALREYTYVQVLFYASLTSSLFLCATLLMQGKSGELQRQTKEQWLRSAGLGFLNPFLHYLALFGAYSLLPAQEAQALNYTWPIVLSILAVPMLKQRLTLSACMGIVISFMGVVVVGTRGDVTSLTFVNPIGCALALSTSLIWALFWLFNVRDQREPVLKLAASSLFGTVYVSALLLVAGPLRLQPLGGLASSVYIGLVEMGVTFILWMKALTLARRSSSVAQLAYLTPFLSLFFIHVMLHEKLRRSSLVGLLLIVIGILVQRIKGAHRPLASPSSGG
jgi:drug/metabolite transporter (DMT)-like permease